MGNNSSCIDCVIKILVVVAFGALIISIFLLLATTYDLLCQKYTLDFSIEGIHFYFEKIGPYWKIFAIPITLVPILLIIYTIQQNTAVKETSALLDIRNALNSKDNVEVHNNLRENKGGWRDSIPQDNDTERKIDNYLGTLELCAILIRNNVITVDNFKNQFGYRVYNVVRQPQIVEKIEDEEKFWTDLLYLISLDLEWQNTYDKNKSNNN